MNRSGARRYDAPNSERFDNWYVYSAENLEAGQDDCFALGGLLLGLFARTGSIPCAVPLSTGSTRLRRPALPLVLWRVV